MQRCTSASRVSPTSAPEHATMQHVLSALEARVIGSLIEKELTTPDQYPLTLNALVAACNQKSNREPLLELSPHEVQATVDALLKAHLVSDRGNFGGRVTRYRQRFVNGEFGGLKFGPAETAIVCELLLRGPQTPGELRAHCQRMHAFADAQAGQRLGVGGALVPGVLKIAWMMQRPTVAYRVYSLIFFRPLSPSFCSFSSGG